MSNSLEIANSSVSTTTDVNQVVVVSKGKYIIHLFPSQLLPLEGTSKSIVYIVFKDDQVLIQKIIVPSISQTHKEVHRP